MSHVLFGIAVVAAVVGVVVLLGIFLARAWLRHQRFESLRIRKSAREQFSKRREWLEAEFLTRANGRGIPRGLVWVDCDFESPVQFAKDRASGNLRALVGVTIRFEAVVGGEMEDVEAVGNLRAATALFTYTGTEWTTDGRALFNLNPSEAIERYAHELEMVD